MRVFSTFLILLLVVAVAGCARSEQATEVQQTGFLGDYSKLQPGESGEAAFRYVNADIDWASYDKIMLDNVTVWRSAGDENTDDLPIEDQQRLANNLHGLLYQELEKDYTMVSAPQSGVIRIQVALTGAERSNATLDVISTAIPVGFVLSEAAEFATGEPSFAGGATVEIKMSDAATGEVLAAAIDKRVGGKDLEGAFDSWDDVNSSFLYWSQLARQRLCEKRGETECVEPTG